jgi:hypothetical protein
MPSCRREARILDALDAGVKASGLPGYSSAVSSAQQLAIVRPSVITMMSAST